jgi:hypothetical protein
MCEVSRLACRVTGDDAKSSTKELLGALDNTNGREADVSLDKVLTSVHNSSKGAHSLVCPISFVHRRGLGGVDVLKLELARFMTVKEAGLPF